jgi:hypothetical protein
VPAWRPARHIEVDVAEHKRPQPPGRPHPRATPGPNGPRPVPAMPLTHPRTVAVSHLRRLLQESIMRSPSPPVHGAFPARSQPIGTPNVQVCMARASNSIETLAVHIVCFCAHGRDAYPGHNLLAAYTGWQVPLADAGADARRVLPCAPRPGAACARPDG